MAKIDITLPDELQDALAEPVCVPFPSTGPIELKLPSGGHIKAINDITDKIPTDCSLSFSLLLQLGPILANLECFLKVLKLLEPLITIITNITDPVKVAKAMPDFAVAAKDVTLCITSLTTPSGIACFLIDILRLIAKLLKCVIGQLKTIVSLLGGLSLQISSAQAAGNTALLASLECAQTNTMNSAKGSMTAVEPIIAVLSLAEPLLGIAGVDPIKIPPLADADSLESIESTVETLEEVVKTIELVADGLGSLC
ncbi:MAG: hypothetical protein ACU826_01510 [Gammaproteobacteria bacterium]